MSERWIVDAMNVIGARPDGWWRDRAGAMRALVERLTANHHVTGRRYTVVAEGGSVPDDLARHAGAGVHAVVAGRRGPDAADDRIVGLVRDSDEPQRLVVVTSDRELAARVEGLGARTVGAGTFRAEIG
ncbi:MAG TPA: NYN domain-containing protein [Nitriliruptorales bacterium]|nr:NYN domain-containing protein [Nitriliruptorales bacterium]